MRYITAHELECLARRILLAAGALDNEASAVAHSLVESDLRGHESHGVLRLPSYVEKLHCGDVRPGAVLEVAKQSPTAIVCEGNWGFGQVQMHRLLLKALDQAKAQGMVVATLRHVTHVGRLGEYSEIAAEAEMVSIIMANAHSSPRVAPPGAKAARIGTNPLALGVPTPNGPLILDFGTAAVAEGKIRQRKLTRQLCPDGWLVDNQGNPTNDPAALYTDPPGAILPFGGEQAYKGFGLAMMIEMFAGALSGGDCICETPTAPLGNCVFLLLINPQSLCGTWQLRQATDAFVRYIKSSPQSNGTQEVLLPGDPERRTRETRIRTGIPIDEAAWAALLALEHRLLTPHQSSRLVSLNA